MREYSVRERRDDDGEEHGGDHEKRDPGGLPLGQVYERIETLYLSGRIDGEERAGLIELMHGKADPENETDGWQTAYMQLAEQLDGMEARIAALEQLTGGGSGESEPEVPEWQMWNGVDGGYAKGDVVQHGGRYWVSEYEGAVNVWEPGAIGVDERYWREISGEEARGLLGIGE